VFILHNFYLETWQVLKESSFYIFSGFFFAGIIHYFIPPKSIARHLGKKKISSLLKASILGVPLPLCSCSVIPTALDLKKSGASKGSVVSFLISTPETGIDSIFITYALMDPIITFIRPIAAFITATFAGIVEMIFGKDAIPDEKSSKENSCTECCNSDETEAKSINKSLRYAFGDLYKDIYLWYFLGVIIAGAISAIVPKELFLQYIGSDFQSMLIMLIVSVPFYICATASTPIAAALVLKGLSPGAAIVFLLAGPATNTVTLTVLIKNLGKRSTLLYLFSIILCSLLFGYMINFIYDYFALDVSALSSSRTEIIPESIKIVSSYVLLVFSSYTFVKAKIKR
jgi:uncharacterized membrane protein YraQ (UPF0718 family)